jgi:hypothetical protein
LVGGYAVAVGAMCVGLAGCQTAKPPERAVRATYRFDGVRTGGGVDEWSAIHGVLAKYSASAPVEDRRRRASLGASEVCDYRATVTLPNMAAADSINADIEALRAGESKIEFGLVDTQIAYRGNTVAAGVTMFVSGFATQGYRVRLFPNGNTDPIELTAGRNGLWSAKLAAAPSDGWLYGISEDPTGKVRPRCFRVNITTQKQELVDEADFWKRYPQWKPAAEAPTKKTEEKDRT